MINFLCDGDVKEVLLDDFDLLGSEGDVEFDSNVKSVMEGEEDLELELDSDMVSVHKANLGGRGGGDGEPFCADCACPARVSDDNDWQCFNIMFSLRWWHIVDTHFSLCCSIHPAGGVVAEGAGC